MKKIKRNSYKTAIIAILSTLIITITGFFVLKGMNIAVLSPQGTIAEQQRDLILVATLLMLIVVIPVFIMTFLFAWRYREGNTSAKYRPEWDNNKWAEATWWLIPFIIIVVLSVIIWRSSHALDPYRPLNSSKEPVRVQVVALNWKWLFIYPDEKVASVNYLRIPEDTPVNFEITADAPMNSFWIPQLGGQVYAMAGMTTKLHLMAGGVGIYDGSSANLSGEGFAGMKFKAESTSQVDYENWLRQTKEDSVTLDYESYQVLARPSKNNPPQLFKVSDHNLYDKIVMKYMGSHEHHETDNKELEHQH